MNITPPTLPTGWLLCQTRLDPSCGPQLAAAALILTADTASPNSPPADPAEQQTRWGIGLDLEPLYELLEARTPFIFGVPGQWHTSIPDILHGRPDPTGPDTRRQVADAAGLTHDPQPFVGTPHDWEQTGDRATGALRRWTPGGDPADLATWIR